MSMMNWFVLTEAQRQHAMTLDDDSNYQIDPRPIDNSLPGVGLNLNAVALGVPAGDVVTLVGKYVAPKRMVGDPDAKTYAPNLVEFLQTIPFCSLETETIFAPML